MAWWNFWRSESPESVDRKSLTAAAMIIKAARERIVPSNDSWQRELWDYYDELGEFRYAVTWKSQMISRVRLRAARIVPGRDEPEILDSGRVVELVAELNGGIGGQSELLESIAVQLDVPGEGYLVGETIKNKNIWQVRSLDEIRYRSDTYEIIDDKLSSSGKLKWRSLGEDSLVIRTWRPNKRYRYLADSPARAARNTMRELELVNRKIQAQYLSRLASAGVFIMPDEVTFPVREEFQEAADPFVLEWIETARESVQQFGTASSLIPTPMRVPAEQVKNFQHIDFTLKIDERIIEKRESAIKRLAAQVDIPAEVLLGMGDLNHWSAWQMEESAVKAHIDPTIEIIVATLTTGYLHPMLKAEGINPEEYVIWYDTSELVLRPDKSDNAQKAYDRGELSPKAYRRELGFDESDKPSKKEIREIGLKVLMRNPRVGFEALSELIDEEFDVLALPSTDRSVGSDRPEGQPERQDDENIGNPPDTQGESPDTSRPKNSKLDQAIAMHCIEFSMDNLTLYHPEVCQDAMFTCPVSEASRYLTHYPGVSGLYDCFLSPAGTLTIGKQSFASLDNYLKGHSRTTKRQKVTNASH